MISQKDRSILRNLAQRQAELAKCEQNQARKARWLRHNDAPGNGQGGMPLIVVEYDTFYEDIRLPLICESELARAMEEQLRTQTMLPDLIGDDRVIPDFYSVFLDVKIDEFCLPLEKHHAKSGKSVAYQYVHPIVDLQRDFEKLKPSAYSCDVEKARAYACAVADVIGDILPVRLRNNSLLWHFGLTQKVVALMGMEAYFFAMYDQPEALHDLMAFLRDDVLRFVQWQESNGLLTPNWGNEHGGSNSFGFTQQLPSRPIQRDDLLKSATDIRLKDLWLNTNSQETTGVSKDGFVEFVLPYYREICARAGLVYYGCCEPVHTIFAGALETLPHLRKLSVSAWNQEELLAEQLRDKHIIYSRKPSPNFIGVGRDLDEVAFCEHIRATLHAAKGLSLEFIFRDIYTLGGNIPKLKRAVDLTRACCEGL